MLGQGRKPEKDSHTRFISLTVTASGMDDGPLLALQKTAHICYIEQQFIPSTTEGDSLGILLIYVELIDRKKLKEQPHTTQDEAEALTQKEQDLGGQFTENSVIKDDINRALHARWSREGSRPMSAEGLALFKKLKRWRNMVAQAEKKPIFVIFSNTTLEEIVYMQPRNLTELHRVKGVGPTKLRRYGEAILSILSGKDYLLTRPPESCSSSI